MMEVIMSSNYQKLINFLLENANPSIRLRVKKEILGNIAAEEETDAVFLADPLDLSGDLQLLQLDFSQNMTIHGLLLFSGTEALCHGDALFQKGHTRQQPQINVPGQILGVKAHKQHHSQGQVYHRMPVLIPYQSKPADHMKPTCQNTHGSKEDHGGGGIVHQSVKNRGERLSNQGILQEHLQVHENGTQAGYRRLLRGHQLIEHVVQFLVHRTLLDHNEGSCCRKG